MKHDPPRIHTLRDGGEIPRTSDSFTPRTLDGSDGAFKGTEYGNYMEGPYRDPGRRLGLLIWIAVVLLVIASVVLVALKA